MRVSWSFLGGVLVSLGWLGIIMIPVISVCYLEFMVWVSSTSSLSIGMFFDMSSVMFLSVVCLITGSIVFYCEWYMDDEIFKRRFMYLVMLFVGSMVALILIPNLVTLLIGWDGLGVTSFLLVVYYQSRSSMKAGLVTALTNRIGDVLILLCVGYLAAEGTWLVYDSVKVYDYWLFVLGIIIASMTKSAQYPFSAWLPEAMAAPTPVSALVHSSTLVTAGVYLVYRCNGIMTISDVGVSMYMYLSLLTMVLAGGAALVELDVKKVVAYSTLSQLGVMCFCLSIGFPEVAMFHLCIHAVVKALLFMTVGVVIHSSNSCQDARFLGQSWKKYPVSMVCMEFCLISLSGFPFLSGFYSKDHIIELGLLMYHQSLFVCVLLLLGGMFTCGYSFRLWKMLVLSDSESVVSSGWGEESGYVKMAYMSLFIGTLSFGWMFINFVEVYSSDGEMGKLAKVMIFLVVNFGIYFMSFIGSFMPDKINEEVYEFFFTMGGVGGLTGRFGALGLSYADLVYRSVEKGWLEKVGPEGVSEVFNRFGQVNARVQGFHFFRLFLMYMMIFGFFGLLGGLIL